MHRGEMFPYTVVYMSAGVRCTVVQEPQSSSNRTARAYAARWRVWATEHSQIIAPNDTLDVNLDVDRVASTCRLSSSQYVINRTMIE